MSAVRIIPDICNWTVCCLSRYNIAGVIDNYAYDRCIIVKHRSHGESTASLYSNPKVAAQKFSVWLTCSSRVIPRQITWLTKAVISQICVMHKSWVTMFMNSQCNSLYTNTTSLEGPWTLVLLYLLGPAIAVLSGYTCCKYSALEILIISWE